MASPTRFPSGVTNVKANTPMGNLPMGDPTIAHTFFDDFNAYAAASWVVTTTGSGTAALANADGGVILLTNGAADDNNIFLQKVGEGFLPVQGKRSWFRSRFLVSDATQSDFVIGMQNTDTTPLDVTDGIYFLCSDDATAVQLICRKNATTGSIAVTLPTALVSATFTELSWYYDGKRTITAFVNNVARTSIDLGTDPTAYLPDTTLTISFGLQNGEAVAKTAQLDYIGCVQER